jgi:hypothetical protein
MKGVRISSKLNTSTYHNGKVGTIPLTQINLKKLKQA